MQLSQGGEDSLLRLNGDKIHSGLLLDHSGTRWTLFPPFCKFLQKGIQKWEKDASNYREDGLIEMKTIVRTIENVISIYIVFYRVETTDSDNPRLALAMK